MPSIGGSFSEITGIVAVGVAVLWFVLGAPDDAADAGSDRDSVSVGLDGLRLTF